jgi:Transposase, Mutator family
VGSDTDHGVGKLELSVPQDPDGRFSTELFERYQRLERALVPAPAPAEMYVQGVSTRKSLPSGLTRGSRRSPKSCADTASGVEPVLGPACGRTRRISAINKKLEGSLAQVAGG